MCAFSAQDHVVGEAIVAAHRKRGDEVTVLRRSGGPPRWDLTGGVTPADAFSGLDAVIHLAGESVASGRWTAARKRAIHDSRVEGTARIVEAIERATPRPSTRICASATGYYGNTGAVTVDEDAPAADDFLGRTCVAWEDAARRAHDLPAGAARLVTDPVGVHGVWVNGQRVVAENGRLLDVPLPGQVLRSFDA